MRGITVSDVSRFGQKKRALPVEAVSELVVHTLRRGDLPERNDWASYKYWLSFDPGWTFSYSIYETPKVLEYVGRASIRRLRPGTADGAVLAEGVRIRLAMSNPDHARLMEIIETAMRAERVKESGDSSTSPGILTAVMERMRAAARDEAVQEPADPATGPDVLPIRYEVAPFPFANVRNVRFQDWGGEFALPVDAVGDIFRRMIDEGEFATRNFKGAIFGSVYFDAPDRSFDCRVFRVPRFVECDGGGVLIPFEMSVSDHSRLLEFIKVARPELIEAIPSKESGRVP